VKEKDNHVYWNRSKQALIVIMFATIAHKAHSFTSAKNHAFATKLADYEVSTIVYSLYL